MTGEFTGPALVAGEVTGVRAFRLAPGGVLQSVSYSEYPWQPGENVATCRALVRINEQLTASFARLGVSMQNFAGAVAAVMNGERPPEPEVYVPPEPAPHQVGQLDCTCGFYAYTSWRPGLPFVSGTQVRGVIAGYGRVTVGSRGFRASHARIVALTPPPGQLLIGWQDVHARYPDVPVYQFVEDMLDAHPLRGVAS